MMKGHIYIYLLGILLLSVSCTGKFREFNTDQSGITDEDLVIDDNGFGIRLGIIQQGIYFNYDFGKGKKLAFPIDTESERGYVLRLYARCQTAERRYA